MLIRSLSSKTLCTTNASWGCTQKMWGDEAARAAEIHIMRGCGGVVPDEKDAQMV